MFLFILIIVIILCVTLCFKFKVRFNVQSFFSKGFRPNRDSFGVYTFCGGQGTGKTTALISYLYDNKDNIFVFSNIHNIHIPNMPFKTFTGLSELNQWKRILDDYNNPIWLEIGNRRIVFVYDELFQELSRAKKIDDETLDFLSQMRKRGIIFLTTCQYWNELPITLRRFVRYQIDCKMIPIFFDGLIYKRFRDGESMKWDDSEQDFVAPLISTNIEKCRKCVVDCFDTNERINSNT